MEYLAFMLGADSWHPGEKYNNLSSEPHLAGHMQWSCSYLTRGHQQDM